MFADYLHCHLSTVYRFVKDGRIPYFKLGGDLRFQKSAIEEWIQNGAMWSLTCLQQRIGEDRWPVLKHAFCRVLSVQVLASFTEEKGTCEIRPVLTELV